jgi:hypothetical protein
VEKGRKAARDAEAGVRLVPETGGASGA